MKSKMFGEKSLLYTIRAKNHFIYKFCVIISFKKITVGLNHNLISFTHTDIPFHPKSPLMRGERDQYFRNNSIAKKSVAQKN